MLAALFYLTFSFSELCLEFNDCVTVLKVHYSKCEAVLKLSMPSEVENVK